MKRIAILGGGLAGVTAAYELARQSRDGAPIEATLFEASPRLGGIVETVREGGFVIECGPDGWVTEKPWARELAIELGLEGELIPSNDATRRTYILAGNTLEAIPDGLKMMVPTDLDALDRSPLFTESAKQAYRAEPTRAAELKAAAPDADESIASFVLRHFGPEVLETIAVPLLSGVLGGDVRTLSVRSVMAPFVAMEREHGSLILALQTRTPTQSSAIFTSLKTGSATLIDHMVATIPPHWIRRNTSIRAITRNGTGWTLHRSGTNAPPEDFDELMLCTPIDVTRALLAPHDRHAAALLEVEASSAVIIAFAFPDATQIPIPAGFGFLVPPQIPTAKSTNGHTTPAPSRLLAATFVDQKFPNRVPPGARLLRAFFGGTTAERMMGCNNDEIASVARLELARILGPLPEPQITVVRRWPRSLPQYAVGHLERMAALNARIAQLPGLYLLGNGYRGVGLPDLIRDSKAAARQATQTALQDN
ncbi:MAG: protoporphyrinogen oxidase [Acidobacteriaceae bacterium]|nr:protoporphyrinogen oxidase [Acidobacteriaceae bacterium]